MSDMQPVQVIAEIANAHQGSPDEAVRLACDALAAGADAVKFQIYYAEELLVDYHPRYQHFLHQAFSEETWDRILNHFTQQSEKVYCDIFGLKALATANRHNVYGFKVHSSDLSNIPLLRAVAETEKPVLLSAGGATVREIIQALDVFVAYPQSKPVLMHGFQSYPTKLGDTNLNRILYLREMFPRLPLGFMDHVGADDEFAYILPLLARMYGVQVIEKHVITTREHKGTDYYSSLTPAEFGRFIETLRRAEEALGQKTGTLSQPEQEYRRQVKKHWVLNADKPAGYVISDSDLVMKRIPDAQNEPVEFAKLVGKELVRPCKREKPLTRADVKQKTTALVIARMASKRLPGKALFEVGGMPAICHLFERLKQAKFVDEIVLCTTRNPEDDVLVELAKKADIGYFRGEEDDVLARIVGAAKEHQADIALRVTGDDILVDPDYVDRAIQYHLASNLEYSDLKQLPSGTEVEVFDYELLATILRLAVDSSGTEYLTTYILDNKDQFRVGQVPVDPPHQRDWRLTLDTEEDSRVIKAMLIYMADKGKAITYRLDDIVEFFEKTPQVLAWNNMVRQRSTPISVCTELNWRLLMHE